MPVRTYDYTNTIQKYFKYDNQPKHLWSKTQVPFQTTTVFINWKRYGLDTFNVCFRGSGKSTAYSNNWLKASKYN